MLIIDDEMIKRLGRLTYKINEIVLNSLKRSIEVVTAEKIKGQRVITIKRIDAEQSPVGPPIQLIIRYFYRTSIILH